MPKPICICIILRESSKARSRCCDGAAQTSSIALILRVASTR